MSGSPAVRAAAYSCSIHCSGGSSDHSSVFRKPCGISAMFGRGHDRGAPTRSSWPPAPPHHPGHSASIAAASRTGGPAAVITGSRTRCRRRSTRRSARCRPGRPVVAVGGHGQASLRGERVRRRQVLESPPQAHGRLAPQRGDALPVGTHEPAVGHDDAAGHDHVTHVPRGEAEPPVARQRGRVDRRGRGRVEHDQVRRRTGHQSAQVRLVEGPARQRGALRQACHRPVRADRRGPPRGDAATRRAPPRTGPRRCRPCPAPRGRRAAPAASARRHCSCSSAGCGPRSHRTPGPAPPPRHPGGRRAPAARRAPGCPARASRDTTRAPCRASLSCSSTAVLRDMEVHAHAGLVRGRRARLEGRVGQREGRVRPDHRAHQVRVARVERAPPTRAANRRFSSMPARARSGPSRSLVS